MEGLQFKDIVIKNRGPPVTIEPNIALVFSGWSKTDTFDNDDFIQSHSDGEMVKFSERIIHSQMFQQFIQNKEEMRREHRGFDSFDSMIQGT